jgi:glycosyltransferase involved in cell wall biosynthesis
MAQTALNHTLPRVLHVISGLEVGGAEMALCRLASRMASLGHPLMVASLIGGGGVEDSLRQSQIEVASLRRKVPARGRMANGPVELLMKCRAFRPQVIMGWMYHGIALAHALRPVTAPAAALLWNIRCTLDESQTLPLGTRVLIRALKIASRNPEVIVYNSHLGRAQHVELGFSDQRGVVLPNGVDLGTWSPDCRAGRAIRRDLGIGPEAFVVGHVARFHAMKGQLDLLAAAASGQFPQNAVLLMVGRGVTPANPDISRALARVPRGIRVVMPGERADVSSVMNALDVFCLSSTSEGCPNVVVEAMACGVPCVVTDVGDAPRMVDTSGWVVPRSCPGRLAEAIAGVAALERAERTRHGELARERAAVHYSMERMVSEYAELFFRAVRQ